MERIAGEPPPVAATQDISSVTSHLEGLEVEHKQDAHKCWYERCYWY